MDSLYIDQSGTYYGIGCSLVTKGVAFQECCAGEFSI